MNILIKKIKSNQLISDSIWSLFGNIIGKGLALLAGIFVARLLGKDIYGEYGIIRNTILTIGIFSTFGLGYTATKYIAEFKFNAPEKIKIFIKYAIQITLIFSALMSLLLFIFSKEVSIYLLDVKHLETPLRILAILIVFNALSSTQIGILAGFGKFKEIAKINSIIGILTFLFSIVLTYYEGLNGALLALLIVQVLNCVFNYILLRKQLNNDTNYIEHVPNLRRDILKFSTPIALQECIYSLTTWLSSILLIKFSNYGELGMYSAAMQWNAIILFIPGILRNVILAHLSSNVNNKVAHDQILNNTVKVNLISTLIPCIIISIFSGLISKSYGESFQGLAPLISIAVFSTIFTSISNVYAQAYTSLGKNWLMLLFRTLRDVLCLVLFIILNTYLLSKSSMLLISSNLLFNILFMLIIATYYNKIKAK